MQSHASLSEVHQSVVIQKKKGIRRVLAFLGPAYLVSVGYMDPGNWATDIAGGSEFGYKLIWVLLMSNLMAVLLQSLSSRLGIVAGMDLAQANRSVYPKWANIPLWFLAEVAIAACDLAEIIGMAIGLNLVFDFPLVWGILITALDTILFLFLLHRGIRVMESFIIALVAIIGISFLIQMVIVSPDYGEVAKGFIPTKLHGSALYISIGIIGATVMPHNLYLHSSLVQTRKFDQTDTGIRRAIKFNFLDTVIALNLAFLVNAAILILAAAAFYSNGYFHIAEIQDASKLLEELFGKAAPLFFGIALIAAGQSSTVTGTLAGQIVMEGYLHLRIQPWLRRLITRVVAIVPAVLTVVYFGENALGNLLILSQVILSLQLAFAVIPLIYFNSDKKIMGKFVIGPWVKLMSWICAIVIVYLNLRLAVQEFEGWVTGNAVPPIVLYGLIFPAGIFILFLLVYIMIHPLITPGKKTVPGIPHGLAESFVAEAVNPYRNIGVAVDFSGKDEAIIRSAIRQGGTEARYTLIHVVESAAARYLNRNAYDTETKVDTENLQKYAESLKEVGFMVQTRIGFGNPATELVKIVKDEKFDLMVMGSHGHRGIKDLIFGSASGKLRHRIDVPLLIVK